MTSLRDFLYKTILEEDKLVTSLERKNLRAELCIQRMAYLKYAIANSDKTDGLEDMYNAFFNLTFDKNGNIRGNSDLYSYIEQTMKNNLGEIPGLPSESVIKTIDSKIEALNKLDENTLNKYIKEVKKDSIRIQDKSDNKKSVADFEEEISDEELEKQINKLCTNSGENIIYAIALKTNIKDTGGDTEGNASNKEETDDTQNNSEKDKTPDSSGTQKTTDDSDKKEAFDKVNTFFDTGVFESAYIRKIHEKELSEEERRKNIEQTLIGIKSLANTSSGRRKEKYEKQYNFLKNCTYDESGKFRSVEDSQKYCTDNQEKELGGMLQMIKLAGTLSMTGNEEARKELQEADPDAWKQAENDFKSDIKSSKSKDKPKEEVIKDKDGSEIHARAKKTGNGSTYVRIKNGKEVGYASKEDFIKAKKRKAANESSSMKSLTDFIREHLN